MRFVLRIFAIGLLGLHVAAPDLAASKFRVLHYFTGGKDGGGPVLFAPLAADSAGNLYGAAGSGGTFIQCDGYGCGVAFKFINAGGRWTEQVLHDFSFAEGSPWSVLALDESENLYGCSRGGAVFELFHTSRKWTYDAIWKDGCEGPVGLLLDPAGNLYGDDVGEYSPSSNGWQYTDLYIPCKQYGCPDGDMPLAPFSWDSKGNLYGTTYMGGHPYPGCNCGVAFQMTPKGDGTWKYHVMHRFSDGNDGGRPYGSLTVDSAGNAYGTTTYGGPYENGNVFKLTPSNGRWKLSVVYGFPDPYTEGFGPGGNLVFDKAGNLYGTAGSVACNGGCGVVFRLSPQKSGKWKYSMLHQFHETDGDYPNGLTIDSQENLYGTTSGGGKYGYGTAFEITP